MKAYLKNYRQAPRKVRLVADMVRGKNVGAAREALTFSSKKAASGVKKLIDSAIANAKQKGVEHPEDLTIKMIKVDEGFTFMRYRARYGGRATPVRRHSSHITVELGEGKQKKAKMTSKQEEPQKAKKPASKKTTAKAAK